MVLAVHSPTTEDRLARISKSFAGVSGPLIGLAVALLYMVSAQSVIFLNDPVYAGAGFWPPAGLSLAALLLLPERKWGWVLGAVAVAEIGGDALHGYPLLAIIPWAAANVLEPLVAALLLLRFGNGGRLAPIPNLLWFLGCGVLVGPVVGALVGGIGTTLAFERSYATVVAKWVVGDGLGVLVVAPMLLSIREWRPLASKGWEGAILSLVVVSVTALAFYPWNTEWDRGLPYLTAPALIWAGMRFGVPGAAAAGFIVAEGANLATGLGYGPLGMGTNPQGHTITLLQVFIGTLLTTGLVVAALSVELADRSAFERTLNEQAERLRQSEERAHDFANIASDWFWETDTEFRYTSIMGASQMLLTGEALGKTLWEAVEGDPTEPDWKRLVSALKAGKAFRDFECEVKTARGRSVWITSTGQPIHNQGGTLLGYRGVSLNITHRKVIEAEREGLQAQLRQVQKLQTVGQLTGGIAHDFNNLLAVIIGNAEMITLNPADPATAYSSAEQILNAAERGSDLTQKLLAFGRRQSLKPERLKLKQVVEGMETLLRRTIGEHIDLQTDLPNSAMAALTDRTLLESAILNLAVNARDAMPQGGTLTIRTGERAAGSGEGALPIGQAVVYVTVHDTGTGIPPEVLSRVFEPFYTTKEVGKGSGLGLPMVYGFAQQTGGHVSIESQEGVGTAVTIVLPAITTDGQAAQQIDGAPEKLARGERVLVVEDEPSVLQFVTTQLATMGYEVVAVSTGPDALEVLAGDRRFGLLFSDVMLPKGMSGVELARRARALKPDLKVLLTSGYSEDVFEQHGRPEEGTLLLRKPYRRRELAETLRKVLDQA